MESGKWFSALNQTLLFLDSKQEQWSYLKKWKNPKPVNSFKKLK